MNKLLKLFFGVILLGVFLASAPNALAANRYWVGSADGVIVGSTANWSTAQNACGTNGGASVPGASDVAYFTSSCTNGALIDITFPVLGINIGSGYTGTITQGGGKLITIGTSGFTQVAGTFIGSTAATANDAITINDGSLTVNSGASFTSTAGILSVERSFTLSDTSSFNHNNGTIRFFGTATSDSGTTSCGSKSFNLIVLAKDDSNTLTISSNCSFNLGDNPTSVGTIVLNGSLVVGGTGTWTHTYPITVNSGGVLMTTSSTIVVNGSSVSGASSNLLLNSGGTFTANNLVTLTMGDVGLNLAGGTFTVPLLANLSTQRSVLNTANLLPSGINLTLTANYFYDAATIACGNATFATPVVLNRADSEPLLTINSDCNLNLGTNPTSVGKIAVNGTLTVDGTGTWTHTYPITINSGGVLTTTSSTMVVNGAPTSDSSSNFLLNSGGTFTANNLVTLTMGDVGLNLAGGTFTVPLLTNLSTQRSVLNTANLLPSGINLSITGDYYFDSATIACGNATFASPVLINKTHKDPLLTINSDCNINLGSNPTSSGKLAINGTLTVGGTGTWTHTYPITVNSGGILTTPSTVVVINGSQQDYLDVVLNSGGSIVANNLVTLAMGDVGLNLSGGTFTVPNLTNLSTYRSISNSANLLPSGLNLTLDGNNAYANGILNCVNNEVFTSLTINLTHSTPYKKINGTCYVSGNFSRLDGRVDNSDSVSVLEVQGDLTLSSTDSLGGSNLGLKLAGTNSQTITQNGVFTLASPITVDKTGVQSLTLATNLISTSSNCTIVNGIVDMNGYVFGCGSAISIQNSSVIKLIGTEAFITAPNLSVNSVVIYKGDADGAADSFLINSWAYGNLEINLTDSADSITNSISVNADLAGYWNMNELSWTNDCSTQSVLDSSGNSNHGKSCPITTGSTAPVTGKYGNAASFDGVDDYVRIEDSNTLDLTDAITISAWIYPRDTTNQYDKVVAKSWIANLPPYNTYELTRIGNSQNYMFCLGYTDNSQSCSQTISGAPLNQWTHLTAVYDKTNTAIYFNGVREDFDANTKSIMTNNRPVSIGANAYLTEYANMLIDDVRIYSQALSRSEIKSLYSDIYLINSITILGNLTLSSGTFISPSTLNVGGNFVNTGGTFTHNNGTVNLTGVDQEISGSNTFFNLSKGVTAPSTLTLPGDESKLQIIAGTMSLTGTDGNLLTLQSSVHGTQGRIDAQGSRYISYLSVHDSNNINASRIEIAGLNITDLGNNNGWGFNGPPSPPPSLGPVGMVNGSYTAGTAPSFTFTLADPDAADTVKYHIQIDDTDNFGSPLIDYTSALSSQGSVSFTVGQAAGSGFYTIGSAGQTLSDGSYYWRALATDNSDASSAFSTANSGAIAFRIDTTPPTTPGTPTTTTPTGSTTQNWSWSSATDSFSGVANYLWRITNSLGEAVTNGSTALTTLTTNLTQGLWNLYVKAADAVGNQASESSAGSVTVDTSSPTITNLVVTPSLTGATITWDTGESASTKVDYDTTTSYLNSTAETDTETRVTTHSVTLSSLVSCATYNFRVRSKDTALNEVVSANTLFTTSGCAGAAEVIDQSVTETALTLETGGTIELLDAGSAGISLLVPPAFATEEANFQVHQLEKATVIETTSSPDTYTAVANYIYEVKALPEVERTITTFEAPIDMTMSYTESDMAGIDEESLLIHRWNGSTWSPLSNCVVNTSTKSVTCSTTHFSVFALFGKSSSSSSSPDPGPQVPGSTTEPPVCTSPSPGAKAPWLYGALAKSTSSIELSIAPGDGSFTHYVVRYGTKEGEYPYGVDNLDRSSYTTLIGSLKPSTRYYFQVRAGNGCATGPWSNTLSSTTRGYLQSPSVIVDTTLTTLPLPTPTPTPTKTVTRTPSVSVSPSPSPEPGTKNYELTTPSPSPTPEPLDPNKYQIQVKVVDTNQMPLPNTKVVLHSTPREGITDSNGLIAFANVEGGEHRLIVYHQGNEGEQSINLSGETDKIYQYSVIVEVNNRGYQLIIGGLSLALMALVIVVLKQRRKNN